MVTKPIGSVGKKKKKKKMGDTDLVFGENGSQTLTSFHSLSTKATKNCFINICCDTYKK